MAPSRAESTSSSKSRKRAGLGKQKRKPASDKSQTAAISQSVSSTDVTSQPSPKRPKQSDVADQQQEGQPEGSSTTSPIGKQTLKSTASKSGKRQHHAKRPCPVCGKDEGNLKRHLKSHAKKGLIEENQVEQLLAVAIHQGKTRGPCRASHNKTKKGLKLRWCPVDNCSTVTHYLRSHLTHFHRMKPGELLNTHLRVARYYQGSVEVTAIQEMIRSMRSQVQKPVATSTTTINPSASTTNSSQSASGPSTSVANLPASDPSRKNESDSESNGENLDPDFEADEDLNAYFEDPNPSNDRQKWLIGFYRYLNTPDCGRKRNKNRRQHARQVRRILEDLDSGGGDINILSEDEGYIVWTDWADPKMEELSSGTIRSYLGTYQMFLSYVTMERVRSGQVPDLPSDVLLILRVTIPKLKGWRKTIDLEMRPQRNQKRLDECDYRLTTQDVNSFRLSGVMQNASLLLERSKHQTLSMQELCLVRDMIIAELTIQTGTRPGALAFAELQHFQTMHVDPSTGMRVMLIPDHKRGIAGPAPVTLSQEMYVKMQAYVSHILPQFGSSHDRNIFLTMEGKRFVGGAICQRLPEIWKKSGVRSDLRVTATNIRKWIVTVCHQKKTEGAQVDESSLRLAMCHSDKTAQTFYLREDITEVAARATLTISQCTREVPIPSQPPRNTLSAPTTQPQVDLQPRSQSDDSIPFSSAQPVTQPDVTTAQVASASEPTRSDVTAVQVTSESEPTSSDVTAVQVTSESEPTRLDVTAVQVTSDSVPTRPDVTAVQVTSESVPTRPDVTAVQVTSESEPTRPDVTAVQVTSESEPTTPDVTAVQVTSESEPTTPDVTAVQVTSESEPTRPDVTAVQVTSESEPTRPDVTAVQVTSESEPTRPDVTAVQVTSDSEPTTPDVTAVQVTSDSEPTTPDVTAVQVTSESEPTRPDVTAVQVTSESEPTRPDVTAVQVTSESVPTRPDVTAVQVTSESEPTRPDVTAFQVTSESAPKRPLAQGEKAEISKIFEQEISSNKKITVAGIREGLKESVLLRGLLLIAGMDRKIADRVRHCKATAPRSLPEETQTTDDKIQQWQEKDSIASEDTDLTSRRGWSAPDTEILERRFANVEKCPKKKELELILTESEELKDIANRNEFKRVHQKLKNLFKKKKKK